MSIILAADIGGTNARFASFTTTGGELEMREYVALPTAEADSFDGLLAMLSNSGFPLRPKDADMAVLAVAGPVANGRYCNPTNIDFDIDLSDAGKRLGFARALLINDFVAQGYACGTRIGNEARTVKPGRAVSGTPLAVVGAGTGFGACALVPGMRGEWLALASEGGHATLGVRSDEERDFERFALETTGAPYLFVETVVRGRGLSLLHEYHFGERLSPGEAAARFTPDSPVAAWFARFYARAARDFALSTLCEGGLFLAGGVAAKNPVLATSPAFAAEFTDHPNHAELLKRMPVKLMDSEHSGLYGAAYRAARDLALAAG